MSHPRQGSKYTLIALPHFEKNLNKLDAKTRARIRTTLQEPEHSPEVGKPLHGDLKGIHSLRIGDYRILYQVAEQKQEVYLISIGHRRHVYQ